MLHPNVHRAFSEWAEGQVLHVACMYSNPQRWPVRRELMNDFRKRTEGSPNVALVVACSSGPTRGVFGSNVTRPGP